MYLWFGRSVSLCECQGWNNHLSFQVNSALSKHATKLSPPALAKERRNDFSFLSVLFDVSWIDLLQHINPLTLEIMQFL